jgi:hypothetical protein
MREPECAQHSDKCGTASYHLAVHTQMCDVLTDCVTRKTVPQCNLASTLQLGTGAVK